MLASKNLVDAMDTQHGIQGSQISPSGRRPATLGDEKYQRGVRSISPVQFGLSFDPSSDPIDFMRSSQAVLRNAREAVRVLCGQVNRQLGINVKEDRLIIVVDELLNNMVMHGFFGLKGQEVEKFLYEPHSMVEVIKERTAWAREQGKPIAGRFKLEFSGGEIVLSITDSGPSPASSREEFLQKWASAKQSAADLNDLHHGRGLKLVVTNLPESTVPDYTPPEIIDGTRSPYWLVLRYNPAE